MKTKDITPDLKKDQTYLVNLLNHKTSLKLDIYQNTIQWFNQFKIELNNCVELIKKEVTDERIRLRVVEVGETETQLFIGSDVLIFSMHTNVFQLDKENYASQTSYVKKNPMNAYCGIINVYDFLADSYEFNRSYDVGYLITRIFINRENHFLMEGKGKLGLVYKDFMHQVLTNEIIRDIILKVSIHGLDFDLFTPPYETVQTATVQDLQSMNYSSKLKTGKRLGFKFESQQKIT